MPIVAYILIGVTVGLTIAWSLFYNSIDGLSAAFDKFLGFALPTMAVAAILLVVALPIALIILKRVIGRATSSLDAVIRQVAGAASASASGNQEAAVRHAEAATLEGLAWYAPIAARRSLLNSCLALLIAAGGLSGTALLLKQTVLMSEQNQRTREQTALLRDQNDKIDRQVILLKDQNDKIDRQVDLLRDQNKKIDTQTLIGESARRSNILVELYSIVNAFALSDNFTGKVSGPASGPANTGEGLWRRPTKELHDSFRSRLVAFSRTATPYWSVMTPRVDGVIQTVFGTRALSPERGQLLIAAYEARITVPPQADFASADITGARLNGLYLPNAKFSAIWGDEVNFTSSNLTDADFGDAVLPRSRFNNARLNGARFYKADLRNAYFSNASLSEVNFTSAILSGARFDNVRFQSSEFSCTNMRESRLISATFDHENIYSVRDIDLDGAVIGRVSTSSYTYSDELDNEITIRNRRGSRVKGLRVSDAYEIRLSGSEAYLKLKKAAATAAAIAQKQPVSSGVDEIDDDFIDVAVKDIELAIPQNVITTEKDAGIRRCTELSE